MGNNNGKTVSDKAEKLLKKLSGGSGGRTASDLDKAMITKAYNRALQQGQGGTGGRTISVNDFMAALKKIRNAKKKKGKTLERKYGGKAKKMKTYSKGGKAK